MATQTIATRPAPEKVRLRLALAMGLIVVGAIALRFLYRFAIPYFSYNQQYYDYYWPHRFRLLFHICGGMLALVCGPFQFWTGLRQKAMTFHRWTGRLYLAGVAIGATGAYLMAVFSNPRSMGVGLMAMATTWVGSSGAALLSILRGRIGLHKEWMARSYITAFAFVTFRYIDELPVIHRWWGDFQSRAGTVAWVSFVVPLFIFEMILFVRRLYSPAQSL